MSRLQRLLNLTQKEADHLQAVRTRLFESVPADPDRDWLVGLLATDLGIDRLESFGAKFARLQDTVMDKLIPALLEAAGEQPGTAIDNLDRLERLQLVTNPDEWIAMRRLRNRLVHEYFERPEDMLPALRAARAFTDELITTRAQLATYAEQKCLA